MRIVVVGAGAMGSLFGGLLSEHGADVILYDVWQEQVDAINNEGLIIECGDTRRKIKVKATCEVEELGIADLMIVFVKSYHTEEALDGVVSCIGPNTLVLTLQNGMGNVEKIIQKFSSTQVLAGITSHGAMLIEPGIIRHNGAAHTYIGPVDVSDVTQGEKVAQTLSVAGIETSVAPDILGMLWTKLIVNAAINPLTALTGLHNGELLEHTELLNTMGNIVDEALQVVRGKGITLQTQDMFEHVKSICFATKNNKSSMLMDSIKGRRTEIDAINGIVVKEARSLNLSSPVNETLLQLVKVLEKRGK